ncbi:MAG TPA: NlpC/P60 family protein [Hyphomicrobium sp.]|nr:NlpC/P60 family protein [Hyphomicrobium sp.]
MDTEIRARVVAAAREWAGTPYHHQASLKHVGADCLGLVRAVWREIYGQDAEAPPPYSPDWAETSQVETMLEAAKRHLCEIAIEDRAAGDVAIFRLKQGTVAKHAAILTGANTMIHAMEGVPVAEVALSAWWRRRIAAVFRFPGA